jgi:hypothetical protein
VVTGRLASSDPNLQNIPVRSEEGRRIRTAFIAPPGSSIVSADYSQIELRIMAHLSGDEGLLHAFSHGEDVHRATAGEIFGVTPLEVGPDQRRVAKSINFGLIYGMSAFGLARQLGLERSAAQTYIDRYFARYPGVARYMEEAREGGPPARLRRNRLRPPPVVPRYPFEQRQPPPGCRARRDQRANAGHGGRPDQAGDDRRAGLAGKIGNEVKAGAAGP